MNSPFADVPWVLVLIGLEFPAIMAMLDCWNRPADHFEGGEPDKRAWKGWLVVGILTVPLLIGYGVLIGYYFSVVRRNSPSAGE